MLFKNSVDSLVADNDTAGGIVANLHQVDTCALHAEGLFSGGIGGLHQHATDKVVDADGLLLSAADNDVAVLAEDGGSVGFDVINA